MYKSHTIIDFNIICILKFVFKRTLTSLNLFSCFFKTHIIYLIRFVPIKIRFNIFMCSLFINYFLVLLQYYFINCTFNNSISLLMSVKFISVCRIAPTVLIMPSFVILRTEVSHDLAFVWWITGDVEETCGIGLSLLMVYTSFTELTRTINRLGVSILGGGFSSL